MDVIDEKTFLITKDVRENKKIEMKIGSTDFNALININPKADKYNFNVGYVQNFDDNGYYNIQIYLQNIPGGPKKIIHSSQHKLIPGFFNKNLVTMDAQKEAIFSVDQKIVVGFAIRKIMVAKKQPIGSLKLSDVSLTDNPSQSINFLEKLWYEKLFTDFVIKVNDLEFEVHKSILAAHSEVFKLMFASEHIKKENTTNTVEITDISPEACHEFLEYIYLKKHPKYNDHTVDLYKAAHKYGIKELIILCEHVITPNINENNAFKVLDLAILLENQKLRKLAFDVIKKDIFKDKELSPNLETNMKLMKELMEAKNSLDDNIRTAKKACETSISEANKTFFSETSKATLNFDSKFDAIMKEANIKEE